MASSTPLSAAILRSGSTSLKFYKKDINNVSTLHNNTEITGITQIQSELAQHEQNFIFQINK